MKIKATRCFCALTIALLAGCATQGGDNAKQEAPAARVEPSRATAPCADCGKASASKAAVDGNLAWRQGKAQDLTDARNLASWAQALKLPLTILVARAQKRDEATGKTEQVDALKHVVLRPLSVDKIAHSDKTWAEVIRELGKHAAQANAHEAQQIVVSITTRAKPRVVQWLNEGIASASNNQKPDIQIFEAKQEKDTALFYQPLDQKQFN
ncbi:MAG: hypothetical protein JWM03_1328 [Rhodocyclales bacterium]|nr:hypothetical protein [Rhodocyclales bacterium]MDB5888456.1 hypothetical protein [Rhodocyclales bacterium]